MVQLLPSSANDLPHESPREIVLGKFASDRSDEPAEEEKKSFELSGRDRTVESVTDYKERIGVKDEGNRISVISGSGGNAIPDERGSSEENCAEGLFE